MGKPKDSAVMLEVGGREWFTGRIGTHKKNMAVKIDEICYEADQRSE
jgi:flagellar motor switch protein FliM